ncbi:MAG: RidA family protein [Chloroflexi bacterium CFX7]|nr:MAG: RidA family protein [bacterium]MCE7929464.1 RidA family protein [Chloroflexi bacterium CFX7]MCK6565839.1 RidA family protein [Dehalococcoidia bacterium]MCL4230806.1 RidA family protein [Dehalococcoidia bacterium]RIL04105.1 MAG: RidA family protein [bacterium]
MNRELINAPGLAQPRGYTHAVSVEGARKLVFVSGQVGIDEQGAIVGPGDLKAQATQALRNLVTALAATGAAPADIVKMNIYIVNYTQSDYRAFRDARTEVLPQGDPPASTLIGVTSLAAEGLMIEIEAVAALA